MIEPILLGGCPRSGTSILAFLIGKNKKILSYLEPSGFYEYFNEYFLRYPIPFSLFRKYFLFKMTKILPYSVSKQEMLKECVNPVEYFSRSFLHERMKIFDNCYSKTKYVDIYHKFAESVFGDFARLCGKERWCVKEPQYLYAHIDKIYRIHPNMKFILIVRDGRDVIASIMEQPWAKSRPNKFNYALKLWIELLEKGHEKSKDIPDHCLITVRLEDLLLNKDEEIKKVCSFVEAEFDNSMRIYSRERINIKNGHIVRWENSLTSKQMDIILERGGHLLQRYGYI